MTIDCEKEDHIRIMAFNNPEKRNALTTQDFLSFGKRKLNFKGI